MGSVIKVLFFLIFFGVWIFKISKKFSEMKNTQSQASYSPQRKERIPQEEIPQPAEESFPELDFEKELEQTPEETYPQPELVEDKANEIHEEKKVPEVALANDSWKSEEVISTLSIDASDARTGIIMSEILGKPIALR